MLCGQVWCQVPETGNLEQCDLPGVWSGPVLPLWQGVFTGIFMSSDKFFFQRYDELDEHFFKPGEIASKDKPCGLFVMSPPYFEVRREWLDKITFATKSERIAMSDGLKL